MQAENFIDRVNSAAQRRYGQSITQRMLYDWVDEDIMPKATATGRGQGHSPIWDRDYRQYRRALQICRLKSQGYKRYSQIRIELWFRGVNLRFTDVLKAVEEEYTRDIRNLLRSVSSDFDPDRNKELSASRIKALNNQMGKAASDLQSADFPATTKIAILQKAVHGKPNIELNEIFNFSSTVHWRPAETLFDLLENPNLLINSVAGILFAKSEIKNDPKEEEEEFITTATIEQYELARNFLLLIPRILKNTVQFISSDECNCLGLENYMGPLYETAEVIKFGKYRLALFIIILKFIKDNPAQAEALIEKTQNDLAILSKIKK